MKKIKLLCLVLLPLLFAWSCKNESGMPEGNWGFVVSIEGSKQGDSLSVEYGAGQITDTVIKLTSDNQKVEFSAPLSRRPWFPYFICLKKKVLNLHMWSFSWTVKAR